MYIIMMKRTFIFVILLLLLCLSESTGQRDDHGNDKSESQNDEEEFKNHKANGDPPELGFEQSTELESNTLASGDGEDWLIIDIKPTSKSSKDPTKGEDNEYVDNDDAMENDEDYNRNDDIIDMEEEDILEEHTPQYRRVCYYTNWSQYRPDAGKFTPNDIDPTLCSHILYAFAKIQEGKLMNYEWNDESTDWSIGNYEKVIDLKRVKPSLKVLLAVGGWNLGSWPFSYMVSGPTTRSYFIDNAIKFLRKHRFDGIDIDWEFPADRGSPPIDKRRFSIFLEEMKSAFEKEANATNRERLLITAAVSAANKTINKAYEISRIGRTLDFINVMTFDLHGSWSGVTGINSPLYSQPQADDLEGTLNTDWAIQHYISEGVPSRKLNMGIPFYGRTFTLHNAFRTMIGAKSIGPGEAGPYTGEKGFCAYYEICKYRRSTKWKERFSEEQKSCYGHMGNQWVGFDDPKSIAAKMQYIKDNNLGGVMIWSLDLDDFNGRFQNRGRYPLLQTINRHLGFLPMEEEDSLDDGDEIDLEDALIEDLEPTTPEPHLPNCRVNGERFPDPRNEEHYFECIYVGTPSERLLRRTCHFGLVFKKESRICDWAFDQQRK